MGGQASNCLRNLEIKWDDVSRKYLATGERVRLDDSEGLDILQWAYYVCHDKIKMVSCDHTKWFEIYQELNVNKKLLQGQCDKSWPLVLTKVRMIWLDERELANPLWDQKREAFLICSWVFVFWCIGQMRVLGIMFLLLCKKADAKREMKTTKEHNYQNFSIRTQSRIAIIRIQNPPFSFLSFWKEWMKFTPQPMMTMSGMMYRRWKQQEVTFLGRIWGYCSNLRSQQAWESENWRERWLAQITVVFLQFIECIGFLWVDQDSVSSYGQ